MCIAENHDDNSTVVVANPSTGLVKKNLKDAIGELGLGLFLEQMTGAKVNVFSTASDHDYEDDCRQVLRNTHDDLAKFNYCKPPLDPSDYHTKGQINLVFMTHQSLSKRTGFASVLSDAIDGSG